MTYDDTAERGPASRPGSDSGRSPAAEELAAEVATAEAEAAAAEATFEHDVADLLRERDDLRELSQRLQADFENYRKRMLREQTAMVERATEGLVEQLLPVLDSFEAALSQLSGDDVDAPAVRKGVSLVADQLRDVLGKAGLEVVDELDVPFDPHEHEAVMQEPGDGEPSVGAVMRAGYKLKGRVLRPAMVKVVHASGNGEGAATTSEEGAGS